MAFTGIQVQGITLPVKPMSPIFHDQLPSGPEWGYQLKWDGVRSLAAITEGQVSLYSKNMLLQNAAFPEVVQLLQQHFPTGRYLLDGEIVMFDSTLQRPIFQRVQQRVRSKRIVSTETNYPQQHIIYVVFDLLVDLDQDMTQLSFIERHERMLALFPEKMPQLFVTDLFHDGELLWKWVEEHQWEGVVSKRLASRYHEGKKHQDWLKKKTSLTLDVTVTGLTLRNGQVASLIMVHEDQYIGRVSLGLNTADKQQLLEYGQRYKQDIQPTPLPSDLKKEQILWLSRPLTCQVTGLELTSAGMLRHPKLIRKPVITP